MNKITRRILLAVSTYMVLFAALLIFYKWYIALGASIIGFTLYSYLVDSLRSVLVNKVLLQTYSDHMEDLVKRMVATVQCAYCSKLNAVRFQTNQRNEFECEHCKKRNVLLIDITAAQVSTPLTNSIPVTEVPRVG